MTFWAESIKLATKTKAELANASHLSQQIQQEQSWSWANNDQNLGELNRLAEKLRSSLAPFHRRFLSEDTSRLRKAYKKDYIAQELETFQAISPNVTELAAFTNVLRKRFVIV